MNGYYDTATPFVRTEYTYSHMDLDEKLQKNIIQTYYEAGHMMYINEACAKKFKTDLVEFLKQIAKTGDYDYNNTKNGSTNNDLNEIVSFKVIQYKSIYIII